MAEPVCVISGVGPGTGTALVRRFASEGYRIAMLARTAERLADLAAQVPSDVPPLLRFYKQYFRRQGSFPIYERPLT